jgi:hypothetical protein
MHSLLSSEPFRGVYGRGADEAIYAVMRIAKIWKVSKRNTRSVVPED